MGKIIKNGITYGGSINTSAIDNELALSAQTLGYTKKNLLKNTATTQTINGVTFTVNSDGSVTVDGTATDYCYFTLYYSTTELPNWLDVSKTYIASVDSTNVNALRFQFVEMIDGSWVTIKTLGTSAEIRYSENATGAIIRLQVPPDAVLNNDVAYPMIRDARITDPTYEPYVDDVDTRIDALTSDLAGYFAKEPTLVDGTAIKPNDLEQGHYHVSKISTANNWVADDNSAGGTLIVAGRLNNSSTLQGFRFYLYFDSKGRACYFHQWWENSLTSEKWHNFAAKSDLDELKKSVSDGKTLVADAITGKGVTTATDATFATMASNIASIESGSVLQAKSATLSTSAQTIKPDSGYNGLSQVTIPAVTGTATAANVLKGKTFASAAGISVTGTMVDNGAVAGSITTSGGTYTVPAGYHNGSGKVTGPTISSLIGTSAKLGSSDQLLSGITAYGIMGTKYTGSMANKSGTTVVASSVTSDDTNTYLTIPTAGYYDTTSKISTPKSNLTSDEYIGNVALGNHLYIAHSFPNGEFTVTGQTSNILTLKCVTAGSYKMKLSVANNYTGALAYTVTKNSTTQETFSVAASSNVAKEYTIAFSVGDTFKVTCSTANNTTVYSLVVCK